MLENIHSDEKNLDEKIEKKRGDYERNLKRLSTLKDVGPAFMDEYESLEKELEVLYESYLVKFRIQSYLEQQLDEYNQSEQEKFEETARTMQMTIKKMKDQEKERNGKNLLIVLIFLNPFTTIAHMYIIIRSISYNGNQYR